jgi:hypothetical protein
VIDAERSSREPRPKPDTQRRTLHELLEQIPASIAVVHCDGLVFEMVNRHYAASAERRCNLIGRRALDAFPQLRDRGLEQMIALVRRIGEPCLVKELAIRDRWWCCVLAPLPDERGEVHRVMSLAHEITELVHQRAELERGFESSEQLTAMLDAGLCDPETGRPARILDAAERMSQLTAQLLDLARSVASAWGRGGDQ